MQQTLLSTKFNVPPPCQSLVHRTRLMEVLEQARTHRITLVSAPPGYGKTTLISSWLRDTALPFSWLSLDESDDDPIRFMNYFLTALHAVVPTIWVNLLDLLQGSQSTSFEMLMALLINEASGAGDFFMVLDDFQALHTPTILDMLGYLLEHLPPGMHMVLLSRTDPPLPLSKLRARGQLLEIRAEQLRFTAVEITQFYTEIMGLALSVSDISAIETRTEGWIAGLQLAGLAMQAEKDLQSFIAAFTGSHAYIMDYLTEEVLRGQPDPVRSFLLQTSILDRMCGPLCENVIRDSENRDSVDQNNVSSQITVPESQITNSTALLDQIYRSNLFLIPLDAERRWYRYHHLFKEVLIRRLEVLYPDQIPGLHRRASEWFEQNGLIHEAIQHAIRARDLDRTARLVEQHGCALLMGGELVTLADWLAAIDPYTHTRPWLAMQKAWVLSLSGQAERADLAIKEGTQLISTLELTEEASTLSGSFSAARALWANTQGKTDLAARYARQAIDILNVGGDFSCALRSVATSLLGDTSWIQGKMEEAQHAYEEAVQIGRIAGNPHMTMMSMNSLADVYFEQGHFHQAARLYAETLHMADQIDGPNSAYAQGVHFGLGKALYAWNRLDEAAVSIDKGYQLSLRWRNVNLEAACLALAARMDLARGSFEKAQSTAIALEGLIQDHSLSPYWSIWVRTEIAHFWLELGKIEKAFFLIRDIGVLPDCFTPETLSLTSIPNAPIPYRLIPAYLILARLFLKLSNPDAVIAICENLMQEANVWGWGKVVTELHILRALAYQLKRDTSSSLAALEKAISFAWPEQSKRVFLDEGEIMGKLLYQAKAHHLGGEFVAGLLFLIEQQSWQAVADISTITPSQKTPGETEAGRGQRLLVESEARRSNNFLVEPLSSRELEILRYIAEGYSNQEIADRFVLSPKTVKRHISNIYAKLEAKNRTQAVSFAHTLKLIE